MKNRGIGLGKTLVVFIVGCLFLILLVNPQITEDISQFMENPGGITGGPPEVNFGELSETYEEDYISQYIWNNYENKKIKISNVSIASFGGGNKIHPVNKSTFEEIDYIFISTGSVGALNPNKDGVYLIDNKNAIGKAEEKYASCEFTIVGKLTKKEVDFGDPYKHDYENVVVVEASEINVHHS